MSTLPLVYLPTLGRQGDLSRVFKIGGEIVERENRSGRHERSPNLEHDLREAGEAAERSDPDRAARRSRNGNLFMNRERSR